MAYLGLSPEPPQIPEPPERIYLDQYLTSPGEPLTCGDYCATMKTEFYSMRYLPRPEGCICPGESPVVDNKKAGFPVQPDFSTELPMTPQEIEAAVKRELPMTLPAPLPSPGTIQLTPQQIEAQVKQIQPAATGGALALAAIAALLLLG